MVREQALLTESQEFLLKQVRISGPTRAAKIMWEAAAAKVDLVMVQQAKRLLANCPVVQNFFLAEETTEKFKMSGKLLNLFELYPPEPNDPRIAARRQRRLLTEHTLYGPTLGVRTHMNALKDRHRPHYGTLNYLNKPEGLRCAGEYGECLFTFNDRVKERCTLTPGDSYFVDVALLSLGHVGSSCSQG